MERISNPRQALDYPDLPDHLFIVWKGNDYKWPDARRNTRFLTDARVHVLKGFALFTSNAAEAKTFESADDARAWLAEQEALRPHPYGATVSTVAEMKRARGYASAEGED